MAAQKVDVHAERPGVVGVAARRARGPSRAAASRVSGMAWSRGRRDGPRRAGAAHADVVVRGGGRDLLVRAPGASGAGACLALPLAPRMLAPPVVAERDC